MKSQLFIPCAPLLLDPLFTHVGSTFFLRIGFSATFFTEFRATAFVVQVTIWLPKFPTAPEFPRAFTVFDNYLNFPDFPHSLHSRTPKSAVESQLIFPFPHLSRLLFPILGAIPFPHAFPVTMPIARSHARFGILHFLLVPLGTTEFFGTGAPIVAIKRSLQLDAHREPGFDRSDKVVPTHDEHPIGAIVLWPQ
jgi:hypothetical protein